MKINGSTFINNRAEQFGGAIVNSENISMINVQASGNNADYGGFIDNGGYDSNPKSCKVISSVFSANHAHYIYQ